MKVRRKFRELIIKPLESFIALIKYYIFIKKKEKKFIILNSIHKSGTTYFRLIFANYLKLYYDGISTLITYKEMQSRIIPNERDGCFFKKNSTRKYREPDDKVIRNTKYRDFIYGHSYKFLERCQGKIISLHRNPLDTIVSRYFYTWANRPDQESTYTSPSDVIDKVLNKYIAHYNFVKKLSIKRSNILRISYEMMILDPYITFNIVLNWLGIPINKEKLEKAVDFANIKNVRKEEIMNGKAIHSPDGYKGYFTRSGKIGQWKEYFREEELKYIVKKLEENSIDLKEFIIT